MQYVGIIEAGKLGNTAEKLSGNKAGRSPIEITSSRPQ